MRTSMRQGIAFATLLGIMLLIYVDYRQRQAIAELIELNHDKSVYIDTGCQGRFQGSEEWLSTEGREQ